jgi:hypothetical protein
MKAEPAQAAGAILILAGCALAIPFSPPWVVLAVTGALLAAAWAIPVDENDRLILRAFAGVPLVIALASTWFWSGVIAQCGILLLLLAREEVMQATERPVPFVAAVCGVLVIGAVIDMSNHMIVPALVITAGFLGWAGILWVRQYRLKRTFRSTTP